MENEKEDNDKKKKKDKKKNDKLTYQDLITKKDKGQSES